MLNNKTTVILQDVFLNQTRKEQTNVEVTFLSGETINGKIKGFDPYTLILENKNQQVMVYKHSICAITPDVAVNFVSQNRH